MAQVKLSLATLGSVDQGSAELIIDRAINEATRDIDDRGADGKPRKIMIEVQLQQVPDGRVDITVAAHPKLPPRQTASTVARVRTMPNGGADLLFQEFSPENPDQTSVFDRDAKGDDEV
jgi:hypothetical protein